MNFVIYLYIQRNFMKYLSSSHHDLLFFRHRYILTYITILFSTISFAQKAIETTNQFVINGLVETPLIVTYQDLEKEIPFDLGNFKITNHAGEFRREYKNVKGILLLTFLKKVKIVSPSPKELSEYYFVFKASDGYTVIASWNEVFNTEIGNSFYLVVEADNTNLQNNAEKILLIATKDIQTGRRHIKCLQNIEVKRI